MFYTRAMRRLSRIWISLLISSLPASFSIQAHAIENGISALDNERVIQIYTLTPNTDGQEVWVPGYLTVLTGDGIGVIPDMNFLDSITT
jgi:hypothetical protein